MTSDVMAIANMSAESLEPLMYAITIKLWDYHELKVKAQKMVARHKDITKNLVPDRKQKEMAVKIAETERKTKEALAKSIIPATFKDMMDKVANDAIKNTPQEHKQKKEKLFE